MQLPIASILGFAPITTREDNFVIPSKAALLVLIVRMTAVVGRQIYISEGICKRSLVKLISPCRVADTISISESSSMQSGSRWSIWLLQTAGTLQTGF
jgi:hypothetical protein